MYNRLAYNKATISNLSPANAYQINVEKVIPGKRETFKKYSKSLLLTIIASTSNSRITSTACGLPVKESFFINAFII